MLPMNDIIWSLVSSFPPRQLSYCKIIPLTGNEGEFNHGTMCCWVKTHSKQKMLKNNPRRKEPYALVSWVFRSLGQDPMLAALVVWCGCQEMTLRVMLEKLIPKVVQSEEAPNYWEYGRMCKRQWWEQAAANRVSEQTDWHLVLRIKIRCFRRTKENMAC